MVARVRADEALALEMVRDVARAERRQCLLERVAEIQRLISARKPLQEVLDAITSGARDLTGADMAGLRLVDPDDSGQLVMPSVCGVDSLDPKVVHRSPVDEGIGGQAYVQQRLIVVDEYAGSPDAIDHAERSRVAGAMGAPVSESGAVVGSLAVASRTAGHRFGEEEQRALVAFAEHASLALTDAKTVDRMYEAQHDPLTALPNRALLLERLDDAIVGARRSGTSVAVLYVDLDRFKLVNESYGHAVGDELLVAVADRIRAQVRAGDILARLGADEFALVLPDVPAPVDAMELADRLITALDEPFDLGGREVHVGASIGVALAERDDEAEDLLRGADTAMHGAKQELMSSWELFEPSMRSALLERIELESDLRRAIEREAFSLAYQPIVEVASGRLVGFEALARWIDADRGFVSPADFIPLAEETGLILPLGEWVMRTACEQLAAWQREHDCHGLLMSINISGVQLRRHGFLQEVQRIVAEAGLQASDVMLEITETVLMQDTDAALARLHALRALGFHLAVDDFGTGYSSLRYVRSFPVDILKVAKDFIDGVANDDGEQAVAAAIVQLGHSLGLRLIAEGIEDEAQQHALAALNCELGQGYHFARPMDPVAAGEWIAEASLAAA